MTFVPAQPIGRDPDDQDRRPVRAYEPIEMVLPPPYGRLQGAFDPATVGIDRISIWLEHARVNLPHEFSLEALDPMTAAAVGHALHRGWAAKDVRTGFVWLPPTTPSLLVRYVREAVGAQQCAVTAPEEQDGSGTSLRDIVRSGRVRVHTVGDVLGDWYAPLKIARERGWPYEALTMSYVVSMPEDDEPYEIPGFFNARTRRRASESFARNRQTSLDLH